MVSFRHGCRLPAPCHTLETAGWVGEVKRWGGGHIPHDDSHTGVQPGLPASIVPLRPSRRWRKDLAIRTPREVPEYQGLRGKPLRELTTEGQWIAMVPFVRA